MKLFNNFDIVYVTCKRYDKGVLLEIPESFFKEDYELLSKAQEYSEKHQKDFIYLDRNVIIYKEMYIVVTYKGEVYEN